MGPPLVVSPTGEPGLSGNHGSGIQPTSRTDLANQGQARVRLQVAGATRSASRPWDVPTRPFGRKPSPLPRTNPAGGRTEAWTLFVVRRLPESRNIHGMPPLLRCRGRGVPVFRAILKRVLYRVCPQAVTNRVSEQNSLNLCFSPPSWRPNVPIPHAWRFGRKGRSVASKDTTSRPRVQGLKLLFNRLPTTKICLYFGRIPHGSRTPAPAVRPRSP